jgi:hypothetical protein
MKCKVKQTLFLLATPCLALLQAMSRVSMTEDENNDSRYALTAFIEKHNTDMLVMMSHQ